MNLIRSLSRKTRPCNINATLTACLAAVFAITLLSAGLVAANEDAPEYVVQDGLVDKATFNGYRRFHGTCHACHGQDAMGGSFAPSLVESLKTVDYPSFVDTVTNGRQSTSSTGAVSAMPAFGHDPNIMKYIDDIYRYVKARSDGVLDTGRPKKQPKK